MCSGVRITTHLKAYRTHPKYMLVAEGKSKSIAKISITEEQSDMIY